MQPIFLSWSGETNMQSHTHLFTLRKESTELQVFVLKEKVEFSGPKSLNNFIKVRRETQRTSSHIHCKYTDVSGRHVT